MSERTAPGAFSFRVPSLYLVAALACGGLAFGAKLMLIQRNGTDVPFWDEWDAVGDVLLIPRAHGDLHAADFLIHHNEHRIVFTRLLSYFLAVWNGQWDGLLEMSVNAAIHAGFCAALVVLARRFVSGARFVAVAVATTALFCSAFDFENTLAGFQSQFYFLEWGALGMFVLCAPAEALGARWWAGWLCGLASLGAMASGFLAPLALLALMAARTVVERRWERRDMVAGALLAALCACGLLSTTHIPYHDRYRAHSPAEWIGGVARLLSWPLPEWPAAFLVIQAPIIIFLVSRMRSRNLRGYGAVLVALALWSWLQIAALSYGRVNYGVESPRYTDVLAVGIFAACVALFLIWRMDKRRRMLGCLALAWMALFVIGLWRQDQRARVGVLEGIPFAKAAEKRHIKEFLSDGSLARLEAAPPNELPYPIPEKLGQWLSDPAIRGMLPLGVRPARELIADAESHGFSVADAGRLPPESGDKAMLAATGPARFVSQEFSAPDLPYIHMSFCGSADLEGAAIRLESLDGDQSSSSRQLSPDHWQSVDFSVPRDTPSRIVVDIPPGNHWFAFTEPVELGRLSWANRWLLRRAAWVAILSGLALATSLILIAVKPGPDPQPAVP